MVNRVGQPVDQRSPGFDEFAGGPRSLAIIHEDDDGITFRYRPWALFVGRPVMIVAEGSMGPSKRIEKAIELMSRSSSTSQPW